jgi:hypothetical protein
MFCSCWSERATENVNRETQLYNSALHPFIKQLQTENSKL